MVMGCGGLSTFRQDIAMGLLLARLLARGGIGIPTPFPTRKCATALPAYMRVAREVFGCI